MKRNITLQVIISTVFLALFSLPVNAQWTSVRAIGGGPNDGCISFSSGGKAYICGGSSFNKVYEYDTATNSWTYKTDIPVGSRNLAFSISFVLNNKLYIVGGDTGGYATSRVYMYDPSGNSWTPKNDFPPGNRDAAFSFALPNAAYVGGGFDGAAMHNDMWKYNESSDTWTQVADLPIGPILFLSSFIANDKGYIVGGATGTGIDEVNSLWQYDTLSGNWAKKADFPGTARQAAFTFSYQNYGYFGGGMTDYTNTYTDVWRYNANTNKWTKIENIPSSCPAWSTAFSVGNTAYVGTGAAFGSGGALVGDDKVYKYRMVVPAAVENEKLNNSYNVYPNPATGMLYIQTDNDKKGSYSLYNIIGQQVLNGPVTKSGINVSSLSRGQYILELTIDGTTNNTLVSLK